MPERPPLGVDFDTLDQLYPTYVVHAFHDTGKTTVVNGRTMHVLRPQTSFGYYVHHDGQLEGWDTALQGAQQIAPDYYRIAVPQGGTETVTTRIVAREPGSGGRYAAWLALGSTFPHGSFDNQHKGDLAATLGFEYVLTPTTSIEGTLGLHRFKGKASAADIDVTQLGLNGKWSFPQQGITPFLTFGAGAYAFDPGSTRFGLNAGAGLRFPLTPQWSVEARYGFHHVLNNSPNTNYSTLQLGLRYGF
jgi:opacity protein-like surface antigen